MREDLLIQLYEEAQGSNPFYGIDPAKAISLFLKHTSTNNRKNLIQINNAQFDIKIFEKLPEEKKEAILELLKSA